MNSSSNNYYNYKSNSAINMLLVLHLRLQLMSNNLLHVTTCYQQVVCERRDNGTGKMVLSLLSAGLNVGCFYAVSTLLNRMITEQYPVSSSSHYCLPHLHLHSGAGYDGLGPADQAIGVVDVLRSS